MAFRSSGGRVFHAWRQPDPVQNRIVRWPSVILPPHGVLPEARSLIESACCQVGCPHFKKNCLCRRDLRLLEKILQQFLCNLLPARFWRYGDVLQLPLRTGTARYQKALQLLRPGWSSRRNQGYVGRNRLLPLRAAPVRGLRGSAHDFADRRKIAKLGGTNRDHDCSLGSE